MGSDPNYPVNGVRPQYTLELLLSFESLRSQHVRPGL